MFGARIGTASLCHKTEFIEGTLSDKRVGKESSKSPFHVVKTRLSSMGQFLISVHGWLGGSKAGRGSGGVLVMDKPPATHKSCLPSKAPPRTDDNSAAAPQVCQAYIVPQERLIVLRVRGVPDARGSRLSTFKTTVLRGLYTYRECSSSPSHSLFSTVHRGAED